MITMQRTVRYVGESVRAIDGAGVRLRRAFGNLQGVNLDPFLLLDNFGSENPRDYMAGFPWHPHRGMETVTYMLDGKVEHQDSLGNKGILKPGEIQWMTAGSGIIHQEMPQLPDDLNDFGEGALSGFQLWVNLPKSHKMIKPRYQDIKSHQIKSTQIDNVLKISVLAGKYNDITGPVEGVIAEPTYLDITLEQENSFNYTLPTDHTAIAYVIDGNGYFEESDRMKIEKNHLVVLNKGENIHVQTDDEPMRFLLMSGKPLHEEIVWHGPIVMNTQQEILEAYRDLQNNTFIKHEYRI